MQIILLIAAILILGKTSSMKNRTDHRLIAGAILGISYFIIWPYVYYYLQLLNFQEMTIQLGFIVLVILSMLIIRVVLTFKRLEIILAIAILSFGVLFISSTSYEVELKDSIAEHAGYFNYNLSLTKFNNDTTTKTASSPRGRYTLRIPESWSKKTQFGTKLPFYKTENKNTGILEFRPRCSDKQQVNITTIVEGLSKTHNENTVSKHQCYFWKSNDYACKITIINNDLTERVRWLATDKKTKRLLELDFITRIKNKDDLAVIDSVFNSVKINDLIENKENCHYSIEWF